MLKEIKKTTKHTGIYALGNIGTKIIGLILIPLYTNADYLSHSDYGALAILESTALLLTGILSMSMTASLSRWFWDKNYVHKQKSIFFTSFSFVLLVQIVAIALIFPFSKPLSLLLFKEIDYVFILKLTVLTASFRVINGQVLSLLILQSKSVIYAVIQIVSLAVVLGIILCGVVIKKMGLEAIWIANLVGEVLIFLVLLPHIIKNCRAKFETVIFKEMFVYGFPLMLTAAAGVILATTDRYMLGSKVGLEDTGIYSLGYRVANTLKIVITTSLVYALNPIRMQKIGTPGNQRFYSKILTYTTFIFVCGLLVLSFFSLEAIKLFSGAKIYWEANNIVPIISFALMLGFMRSNVNIGLMIEKQTKIIGTLVFVTSVLNIGLNLLFIPYWNIYGAAVATLAAQLFFFVATFYYAQKCYKIPYEWKKLLILIISAIAFVLIALSVSEFSLLFRILIKGVLLLAYPFLLYLFNFYDAVELDAIKKILGKWRYLNELVKEVKMFITSDKSEK